MSFFNNLPWNKNFYKEYTYDSEYCCTEKKAATKQFIIKKDEAIYDGATFFHELIKDNLNNMVVICIGTDKCVFDSLAPFVGSILKYKGFDFPVYGTIENPIHAINLEASLAKIKDEHPNGFFIGIDACYGDEASQFEVRLRNYPIQPGTGINKILPYVGSASIIGIIAVSDDDTNLYSIRLRDVISMANKIADILIESVKGYTSTDLRKDNILNFE